MAVILSLANQYGSVKIDPHGARVVSYVPKGGSEVFATFADGTGGMPICAPWFASLGPKGARRHGAARYQDFRVVRVREGDETSSMELTADSDAQSLAEYPHAYKVTVNIRLERTLSVMMRVQNTGKEPMPVTAAFHPYFRVGDAERCSVEGVGDNAGPVLPGPARVAEFPSERSAYSLVDPVIGRTLEFVSAGDREVAVWNPGESPTAESRAKTTSKFRPGESRIFVAVENGLLWRESEVMLEPGKDLVLVRTIRDVKAFPHGQEETALRQGRIDAPSAAGGWVVAED